MTGRRERVRGVAVAVCDDGVGATSSVECGRRAVAAVHGHPRTSPPAYRGAPVHGHHERPECRPRDTLF